MSVAVSLQALWERIDEFGDRAYLVTVAGDGRAHVVSVRVRADDAGLVVGAGRTSRANVAANPAVTLLWPPSADGAYSLILDGAGQVLDEAEGDTTIRPTRAVLHRVAGASGEGPGCVPVLPAE